ncbi:hypothetical protein pdam_00015062 [Pocillopora damicornis]|uniref:Uncharacterized protein n=1 Tax=Pocillopora damicornis TaxID=46731 RepID=A0A3M6TWU4_POCDA|nr:uncharacterized protein LOC113672070 [Pocillopora damicornis]RMX45903.1 hypothetical protein pdam_00015062 [Pocillopora damicornis]
MTSHGKETKPRPANTSKCKLQDENITLGNVVGRLNLAREKMIANTAKKAAILEALNQVGNTHNVFSSGAKKDPRGVIHEMNFMRKSLQSQLKIEGHKTGDRNSQLTSKKPDAGRLGCSAGKMSSVVSGVGSKRIDRDKKYCREEPRETPLNTKKHTTLNRPQKNKPSVYSRYTTTSTPLISIDNSCKDNSDMIIRKNSQSKAYVSENLSSREQSDSERRSNIEFEMSNCNEEIFLSTCSDPENSGVGERKMLPEEISCDEKEVLNQFTDPQLKESLQNIIKRRKSSVRFVKSESGYEMVNVEPKIGESLEEKADKYEEEQVPESVSVAEVGDNSEIRSVKSATPRKVSVNQERVMNAATFASGVDRCQGPITSRQNRTRSRKISRQEQGIISARRISSARSCTSSVSQMTQRTLSSPILRRRKVDLQTDETRVIRPATAKGYVPNLTSRKILRKVSAMSCPEIVRKRDEAKTLAQVNMFREFLLMYSKVAAKNEDELPGRKPVRMMSQTPELVIKSAIGQFLTRAFPSDESKEWTGLNSQSKKERYEEQQRSKLLRIKICMKHLASVA